MECTATNNTCASSTYWPNLGIQTDWVTVSTIAHRDPKEASAFFNIVKYLSLTKWILNRTYPFGVRLKKKKKKKQLTLALTFICQINKNEVCRSAPYLLSLIPLFPLFPSCSFYCLRLIDDYFRESKPAQSLKNLARNCYCDSIFQTLLC